MSLMLCRRYCGEFEFDGTTYLFGLVQKLMTFLAHSFGSQVDITSLTVLAKKLMT